MNGIPWGLLWPPLIAAAAALTGVIVMIGQLRRARLIEDTPTSKIRSAAQGYVELHGFACAVDDSLLVAPLTGTRCLWYRYKVERLEEGRHGNRWRVIQSATSQQFFLLDDHSGRCLVDPRQGEVTTLRRQRWLGGQQHSMGLNQGRMAFGGSDYRYTEARLEEGDWLYLIGWFTTPRMPGFEEQRLLRQKQLLSEWKQNQDALVERFDVDGNGLVDVDEWERAREVASFQAAEAVIHTPVAEPLPVISRGSDRRRPYLIASEDPRQLSRRYRWRAFGALLLGAGLAIGVLAKVSGL